MRTDQGSQSLLGSWAAPILIYGAARLPTHPIEQELSIEGGEGVFVCTYNAPNFVNDEWFELFEKEYIHVDTCFNTYIQSKTFFYVLNVLKYPKIYIP